MLNSYLLGRKKYGEGKCHRSPIGLSCTYGTLQNPHIVTLTIPTE